MNKLNHVAFIMDGNGRWGKKRNKGRNFGHINGVKTVKKIVQTSMQLTLIWSFLFLLFFLFDGTRDVKTVMIFFLPIFFLFGTIFGNVNAIAISPMGHIAGTASAVIGTSTTLLALPIASLVAIFFSGTLVPFICLVIVTNSLNLLITRKLV